MKIRKSTLKKIIKEEILREMNATFDEKQNKRLALIRKALADNEDFSNEIDNLTQNEWQYIQRHPPIQDIEPLFEMLKSNKIIHYRDITPKMVSSLISLAEKPNLRRLIMPFYDLFFQSKNWRGLVKKNHIAIEIKPLYRTKDAHSLFLTINKSANKIERFKMFSGQKSIGVDVAFDEDLKHIMAHNGEFVFFQDDAEADNPIYHAYLSGKKTKEIVDELEKELGGLKAFDEFRKVVRHIRTEGGFGLLAHLLPPGGGSAGNEFYVGLMLDGKTITRAFTPESILEKLPPVENVVPQVLLKYAPHNLNSFLQDDNPLKEKK